MSKKLFLFILYALSSTCLNAMMFGEEVQALLERTVAQTLSEAENNIKKARIIAVRTKGILAQNGLDFDHGSPAQPALMDESKLEDLLRTGEAEYLLADQISKSEQAHQRSRRLQLHCKVVNRCYEDTVEFCKQVLMRKLDFDTYTLAEGEIDAIVAWYTADQAVEAVPEGALAETQ